MYEDREGDLWLGTDSGGLHLLRDQKFTTYTTSDGLSGNFVRCVFQSANGELWIGTDGAGLNRRTSTGFAHFTTADGLSSNVILSLAGGAGGDLWIGTPDGLNLLHQRRAKRLSRRFTSADGLPDDFIRSLYTDRDGSLWIGTRHGLAHWSGGKFTSYSSMDGLGSDFIGAILRARAPRGRSLDRHLRRPEPPARRRFHQLHRAAGALQQHRHRDRPGHRRGRFGWAPTAAASTACSQAAIQAFPWSSQGLPGTIYGMLEDASGHLWLSSKTGIFRVSIAAAQRLRRRERPAPSRSTAYGTADGMNIRECSGGGHPAAWKLADGSLWFATLDGVSFIDPDARAGKPRAPSGGHREGSGR